MIDCHTHLQPHGRQPAPPMTRERIDAYVRAGAARGVTQVAITEHLFRFREAYEMLAGWWDIEPDPLLAAAAEQYWRDHVSGSVADYVRAIEDAKSAGVPVLLGIEMDWIPGREDALRRFLAPYDWDIVLGSVHFIGGWGLDLRSRMAEWDRRGTEAVWRDYRALVRDLAASKLADVLAHPDLPKVFGHRPADETPLHAVIVDAASAAGTAIELNTHGLNKPCREIYPAPPLIERAHDAGLAITLASDAHTPDRTGEGFDLAAQLARRCGYREAIGFVNRKPVAYELT